jgi:tetratricopeptide (TPR) repeat protein
LTITPEHRAYYLDTMGVVLLTQGRITESITALNESIELLPKDNAALLAEASDHLAKAYRAAGDGAKALELEKSAASYRDRK